MTEFKTRNQQYALPCRLRDIFHTRRQTLKTFRAVPKTLLHCCGQMAFARKTEKTPTSQKDQLAAEAIDRWGDFQESLFSVKRKYPISQFQAFWSATKRYAESTKADALIHRAVVVAVHGLVDFLSAERKRVPGDVLRDVSGWSASFLWDMTRTSRVMNRQDCDAFLLSGDSTIE